MGKKQILKITMLGGRGVGKTSLLTAMYEQFDSTIGETNLQLIPDPKSSARLAQRLGQLKAILDDFEATGGLGGTEKPEPVNFELGKRGAATDVNIVFQDFPGGYIDGNNEDFIKQTMEESAAVLIAIDTPPLMESEGQWNDLINRPKQICDIFKRNYKDLKKNRLVLLVPVRCEKYLQNEQDAIQLRETLKEKYNELLKFFGSDNMQDKVACVITPVQTVGTVIFSRIQIKESNPYFYFRKIRHDAKYNPQDSDQPLRYVLSFLLKDYCQRKGVFARLKRWMRLEKHLEEAAIKCSQKCKNIGGFAILQGEDKLYRK